MWVLDIGCSRSNDEEKVAVAGTVPCYDAELIQKIAEESGYTADYIKEEGEYASGGWLASIVLIDSFSK